MPAKESKSQDDVRKEAEELAREMAHDLLQFTRAAWRLGTQMGKVAVRAAEEVAVQAEDTWERERSRLSGKK